MANSKPYLNRQGFVFGCWNGGSIGVKNAGCVLVWWKLLSCMHFSCQKPVDWKDQTRNKKPYIHAPPQAQKTNIVPENAISIQQKKNANPFLVLCLLLGAFGSISKKTMRYWRALTLWASRTADLFLHLHAWWDKSSACWDFPTWRNRQVSPWEYHIISFFHFTRDDSWQLTVQQHLPQKKRRVEFTYSTCHVNLSTLHGLKITCHWDDFGSWDTWPQLWGFHQFMNAS